VSSEKAVKLIDMENTLLFETELRAGKEAIKKEIEKLFKVKVDRIRTMVRHNTKFAYVRFAKANPAVDIATKLGMI
jgi:ribosomal protein L23